MPMKNQMMLVGLRNATWYKSFKEINEFFNKKLVIQTFFCMAMHITSLQSLM
jgi:hypothetical protein